MKVAFFKRTNLAKNPDVWAEYLKKYKNIDTFVTNALKDKNFDFVHFNNTYENFDGLEQKSLMHYHGHPEHENKRGTLDATYPGHIIINAAHTASGANPSYEPIRWFPIDLNSKYYDVENPCDKIRICYTPSVIVPSHNFPYHSKGFELKFPILKSLKQRYGDKIEITVIANVPYNKCLEIKAKSNIIIDECVTGNYHMSGFEGLGMGKMVVGNMSDANKKLMLEQLCPNADRTPYEDVSMDRFENFFVDLIENNRLDFVLERGKQNKEWVSKNWDLSEMLDEMIARYEKILNKEEEK